MRASTTTRSTPPTSRAPYRNTSPLWIGGRGERKTLRMAAQYADGWNVPYIGPEEFARLSGVLDIRCDEQGRDPATIDRTVNLQFNLSPTEAEAKIAREKLEEQWGDQADRVSEGALQGTPDDAFDRVSMYCDAGAAGVNVALRAPWSEAALRRTSPKSSPPSAKNTAPSNSRAGSHCLSVPRIHVIPALAAGISLKPAPTSTRNTARLPRQSRQ